MKRVFSSFLLLICLHTYSQMRDTLYLKNGERKIVAKVLGVDKSTLRFKPNLMNDSVAQLDTSIISYYSTPLQSRVLPSKQEDLMTRVKSIKIVRDISPCSDTIFLIDGRKMPVERVVKFEKGRILYLLKRTIDFETTTIEHLTLDSALVNGYSTSWEKNGKTMLMKPLDDPQESIEVIRDGLLGFYHEIRGAQICMLGGVLCSTGTLLLAATSMYIYVVPLAILAGTFYITGMVIEVDSYKWIKRATDTMVPVSKRIMVKKKFAK